MKDALLLTMMNPAPQGDAEFNDWADTEHLPERRRVPGIHTALRFRNQAASPRYMAMYDLEDLSVLASPAYRAIAGDHLSPWSKRILAGATSRWRFEGSRIDARPPGQRTGAAGPLAELLLVLWRGLPSRRDDVILTCLSAALEGVPGVLQWRAFCGRRDDRVDYVGVVEAGQALAAGLSSPERYASALSSADAAHLYTPI